MGGGGLSGAASASAELTECSLEVRAARGGGQARPAEPAATAGCGPFSARVCGPASRSLGARPASVTGACSLGPL